MEGKTLDTDFFNFLKKFLCFSLSNKYTIKSFYFLLKTFKANLKMKVINNIKWNKTIRPQRGLLTLH